MSVCSYWLLDAAISQVEIEIARKRSIWDNGYPTPLRWCTDVTAYKIHRMLNMKFFQSFSDKTEIYLFSV